jgi:hypothetical protein
MEIQVKVFIAFIGIALAFILTGLALKGAGVSIQDGMAQKGADEFLLQMGMKGTAICAGYDSDGDGYVSCPYRVEGDNEIHALECAGSLTLNHGCRVPKATLGKGVR